MFAPLPFSLHATTGCPPHAELALSLAWTFEDLDAAELDARLDALAERLPAPASTHPLDELKTLVGLESPPASPGDIDTGALLEPRWLAQGRIDRALQVAELRMCLPFDEAGRGVAERKLAFVRARLN